MSVHSIGLLPWGVQDLRGASLAVVGSRGGVVCSVKQEELFREIRYNRSSGIPLYGVRDAWKHNGYRFPQKFEIVLLGETRSHDLVKHFTDRRQRRVARRLPALLQSQRSTPSRQPLRTTHAGASRRPLPPYSATRNPNDAGGRIKRVHVDCGEPPSVVPRCTGTPRLVHGSRRP